MEEKVLSVANDPLGLAYVKIMELEKRVEYWKQLHFNYIKARSENHKHVETDVLRRFAAEVNHPLTFDYAGNLVEDPETVNQIHEFEKRVNRLPHFINDKMSRGREGVREKLNL